MHHASFWGRWRQRHWKTNPGVQQERVPHFGCSVWIRRNYLQPIDTSTLLSHTGNVLEQKLGKSATKRIVPRMILILRWDPQSVSPMITWFNWFRPRRGSSVSESTYILGKVFNLHSGTFLLSLLPMSLLSPVCPVFRCLSLKFSRTKKNYFLICVQLIQL